MNRIGSIFFIILVLFCMAMSAGCSKPRVELAVASQPNVNPDHSSRPSPVIVKVYELRNDLAFKQAEFTTLFDTPLQVLGADLVAADEVVFIPGEARRIAYQPNPNTRFVGVVAGFRQMDRALWRVIKPVDPEEENWLSLELNDTTIIVVPDKEAEDWDPEKAIRQFQQQLVKPQQQVGTGSSPITATPANQPEATTPARPSQSAVSTALGDAARQSGTPAEQGAKEAITIINPNGVEVAPSAPSLNVPNAPMPPVPSDSTPSLPAMRPFLTR